VPDPTSAWGRAGLQTGDQLAAVNGRPVGGAAELAAVLAPLAVGERVRVDYLRGGALRSATVTVAPYERLRARIVDVDDVTERQRAARRGWLLGPAVR
jgi:S1-C subfamily serine protease